MNNSNKNQFFNSRAFVNPRFWQRLEETFPSLLPTEVNTSLRALEREASLIDRLANVARQALLNQSGADERLRQVLIDENIFPHSPISPVPLLQHKGTHKYTTSSVDNPEIHHFLIGPLADSLVGVTRVCAVMGWASREALLRLGQRVVKLANRVDAVATVMSQQSIEALGRVLDNSVSNKLCIIEPSIGATYVSAAAIEQVINRVVEQWGEHNLHDDIQHIANPHALEPQQLLVKERKGVSVTVPVKTRDIINSSVGVLIGGHFSPIVLNNNTLGFDIPEQIVESSVVLASCYSKEDQALLRDAYKCDGNVFTYGWSESLMSMLDPVQLQPATREPTLEVRVISSNGFADIQVLDTQGTLIASLDQSIEIDRPMQVEVHWQRDSNSCHLNDSDEGLPARILPISGDMIFQLPYDFIQHNNYPNPLIEALRDIIRFPPIIRLPREICIRLGQLSRINVRVIPMLEEGLMFEVDAPAPLFAIAGGFSALTGHDPEPSSETIVSVIALEGAGTNVSLVIRALRADGTLYAENSVRVWIEASTGSWVDSSTLGNLGLVATHAALMIGPPGREDDVHVLCFGYNQVSRNDVNNGLYQLWSPRTSSPVGSVKTRPLNPFCAGHAQLSDGQLLVVGGHTMFDWYRHSAAKEVHMVRLRDVIAAVSPFESEVDAVWVRKRKIKNDRWYPTLVTLPSNYVSIIGGSSQSLRNGWSGTNEDYEVFSPDIEQVTGSSHKLPRDLRHWEDPDDRQLPSEGRRFAGLYPFGHLLPTLGNDLPNGLLMVLTEAFARLYDPVANQLIGPRIDVGGMRTWHTQGTSVLLPIDISPEGDLPASVRMLIIGGGSSGRGDEFWGAGSDVIHATTDPARSDAIVLEYTIANRQLSILAPAIDLPKPRFLCDSVLLADGSVLITGGAESGYANSNQTFVPEPWVILPRGDVSPAAFVPGTPISYEVRVMAETDTDRRYHASAVLLPNGKVFVGGSSGGWGDGKFVEQFNVSIFNPPYLTCGAQPEILDAPREVRWGDTITLRTSMDVKSYATLVRFGSSTHSLNTDQRVLRLHAERDRLDRLQMRLPSNGTVSPPGYYMLFVFSELGRVSPARIIRVRAA